MSDITAFERNHFPRRELTAESSLFISPPAEAKEWVPGFLLLCSFTRADGSPVTERRPTIRYTVKMKSRKTFVRMHVGFINIAANRAKCTLLSASRV